MAFHRNPKGLWLRDDDSRKKRPAAGGGRPGRRAGGVAVLAQATSLRFSPLLPSAPPRAIMPLQSLQDRL